MASPRGGVDVEQLVEAHSREKVPLDRWNRYLIVPEGGTKTVPHTRVTTVAETLEDSFQLGTWKQRMVAIGLGKRADLWAEVAACSPEDTGTLDKLVEAAKEAGGASTGANLGKALHAFTERHDRGEDFVIPPPWDADIRAYRTTLGLHDVKILPDLVERYVVLPEMVVAGKPDRIVDFGSVPKVFDVKTGKLERIWLKTAIQCALYSRARYLYDPDTRTHTPMPAVDQDVALIAHLPPGTATCRLYWLDIAAGWEAAQLALTVREWRKRKDLGQLWDATEPVAVPDVRRQRLIERLEVLKGCVVERGTPSALERVARYWPEGVPTFRQVHVHDTSELDQIAMAISMVEKELEAPFGPPDPSETIPAKAQAKASKR